MADELLEVFGRFFKCFRDMGDGTHAEVMVIGSGSGSGGLVVVEITLSLDTNIYASGDVLFDTQELEDVCPLGWPSVLYSLQLLDEDDQAAALDLLFLRSNQSIGTENDAFNPSDAVAREILTEVPILAGEYNDYTNSQQAIKQVSDVGMGIVLQPTAGTSLYVAGVSRGTPTYSATGMRLRVGFVPAG